MMKEVFTKEALNTTEFKVENEDVVFIHTCCGKFNIIYDNTNNIGYILSKNKGK